MRGGADGVRSAGRDRLDGRARRDGATIPQWNAQSGYSRLLVVGDLLAYWLHRAFHVRPLWRFHAVHHSSTHLDWLSSAGLFPGIDRLFGTYYMPQGRLPQRFGLNGEAVAEGLLDQLAYPFRRAV